MGPAAGVTASFWTLIVAVPPPLVVKAPVAWKVSEALARRSRVAPPTRLTEAAAPPRADV